MADLLGKGFKTAILKMTKELKEDVEKVKKTMHKQKRNIKREETLGEKKPRSNSGAEKYNN